MKIVGVVAGLAVVALIGAGAWWLHRRAMQKKESKLEPRPVTPNKPRPTPDTPQDHQPRSHFIGTAELPDPLREFLDANYPEHWPPRTSWLTTSLKRM